MITWKVSERGRAFKVPRSNTWPAGRRIFIHLEPQSALFADEDGFYIRVDEFEGRDAQTDMAENPLETHQFDYDRDGIKRLNQFLRDEGIENVRVGF